MKLPLKLKLKNYLRILNPLPPIGGLFISDSSLKFLLIKEPGKAVTASLRLPPGIIQDGKLKDPANFRKALKTLHGDIAFRDKPVHVILLLPPGLSYTQSFTIPFLAGDRLEEAVKLNLEMISPIDFKSAYSSSEKIGEKFEEGGQFEFLGAFVEARLVDDYLSVLHETKFITIAVEFPALALVRLASRAANLTPQESYLLLDISGEGVSFMIMRNFNLYFSYFHSWQSILAEIGGKKIAEEKFNDSLIREIQKVLNFYSSRWGGALGKLILSATGLSTLIIKNIEANFTLKVVNLVAAEFPNLKSSWFPVLGSALRGLIPRSEDNFISLTNAPVQIQYWRSRVLNFFSLWRKVAFTVLIFIGIVLLSVNIFSGREERKLNAELIKSSAPELQEVKQLEEEAEEFNRRVLETLNAYNSVSNWSEFFSNLNNLASGEVSLDSISVKKTKVVLTGSTKNESLLLAFRDRLRGALNFEDINLPPQQITLKPDGSVNFRLDFNLKSLEF